MYPLPFPSEGEGKEEKEEMTFLSLTDVCTKQQRELYEFICI